MNYDPQAVELNNAIKAANPHVLDMLSERGKAIFFPKKGILSQSAEAKGAKINGTIGTALEDNGNPMVLASLFEQLNLKSKSAFNYAPSPGSPDFRKTWNDMMTKKNPLLKGKEFSQPVVTSALTHGLSMTGYLFVNEGDEIISPSLYWENYDLVFGNAYGGELKFFPAFNNDSAFNVEGLKSAVDASKGNKVIVLLNFPNNPTGYTVSVEEAKAIKDVLVAAANKGKNVVVIIDDAYFGLVYEDGILSESMFGYLADAHERILAVKLDGPTKEDYAWGFRVGFATFGCAKNSPAFYGALEAKLGGAIRGNISNATNLGQTLLNNAYMHEGYGAEKTEKYEILKRRYQKIKEILAAHAEYAEFFTALPFNSGYFMCVQIKSGDAEAVRKILIEKYSTGTIAFNDVIRIAFSSVPLDLLEDMFANVYKACRDLAGK